MTVDRQPASVVVVGAGLAGARAVTALRNHGFGGRVTLLGDEGMQPYDRPPLSKQLLTRTTPAWLSDEVDTNLAAADDVRLAATATRLTLVDDGAVVVGTPQGDVTADAAVLATGARAVLPAGWDGAMTLHSAADAAALRAALLAGGRRSTRLVVVGAGWIGAEVAGVAAAAGIDVTVVEAAAAPLAGALGVAVGARTAGWYASAGVRLVTGARVGAVDGEGVHLASGELLPADVVLAAVGARPTSAWLDGAVPLDDGGAVPVDGGYRVLGAHHASARVVAVGDLASRRSARHGRVPGGHWDGALRGPDVAVRSLLTTWPVGGTVEGPVGGEPAEAPGDPAPYVFSTQLGHELGLYGLPGADDDVVLRGGDRRGRPLDSVLWFAPGTSTLTAVLAVDRPRDVAAARRLFSGAALPELDRDMAADPDRPLRDAAVRPPG